MSKSQGGSKKVSIIITTRNSARTLKSLLESIKKQSFKNFEILVIDNNSSDQTVEIAKLFTPLVFQKGPERSAQRNFGAKKASGENLLFLDSDMILTKNVVSDLVKLINQSSVKGVIIPEKSVGEGLWAKAKILEREINSEHDYFEAARFFRKEVFLGSGGYDETLTGPEDWDLPRRIGENQKIGRIKSFILHDEGNLKLSDLIRKKYYYGLSAHKFLKKHKVSIFSPVTIYLFRPAFYKNWKKMLFVPKISLAMFFMLIVETIAGGIGYLRGRLKNE